MWYLFYANDIQLDYYSFLFSRTNSRKARNEFVYENLFNRARAPIWWCAAATARQQKGSLKLCFAEKVCVREGERGANRSRDHSYWSTDSRRMCTQTKMEKRNFIWEKIPFRFDFSSMENGWWTHRIRVVQLPFYVAIRMRELVVIPFHIFSRWLWNINHW